MFCFESALSDEMRVPNSQKARRCLPVVVPQQSINSGVKDADIAKRLRILQRSDEVFEYHLRFAMCGKYSKALR